MRNRLILTVGLPRSGKSTWARRQRGVAIVNPDSIRLAIHGQDFYGPAEPLVWATAKIMVRSLFMAGHTTVILDATNLTHYRRAEWLSKDWDCVYRLFNADPETCKQRAKENGREYLIPVIDRMAADIDSFPRDAQFITGDIPVLCAVCHNPYTALCVGVDGVCDYCEHNE